LYFDNQSNARRNNKEMLTMTQIHDIRKQYFEEGKTISVISKELGFDRKTIRGYLNKDDFNICFFITDVSILQNSFHACLPKGHSF